MLETTKQGTEIQSKPNWDWVEASVWTKSMLTALENGVKGGKWFSLIDKVHAQRTLKAAWNQVRSRKGAAGVDHVSVEVFSRQEDKYLEELAKALSHQTYKPEAVKRVYIPKGNGQQRPLGIPAVKDRVVQTALKMVLEPIFEHIFMSTSYGFRPGRGAKDALREVDKELKEGNTFVVDADLKSFFDTIPHDRLMARLKEHISDGRVQHLIEQFLNQSIWEDLKLWLPTGGTPQGAVMSPLLANIYLHTLDALMRLKGFKMVRYADDFVVLCPNRQSAQNALQTIQQWVEQEMLELHPDKTHVGDCRKTGEGFEFLGYRFEAGKRLVRKKSRNKLFDRIREKTPRQSGVNLKETIDSLNLTLKGWYAYFKHAHFTTFKYVDSTVRRRLRAILLKNEGKTGSARTLTSHQRWPNKFFKANGLFTRYDTYLLDRQSR